MTLYEIVRHIEGIASAQPSINMIVENDIDKLNTIGDAQYGIFAFVQGQHSTSADSDWITYAFTLYYIDRLTEDDSNLLEVQSVGVQTLDNTIRSIINIEDGLVVTNYTFQPFLHSFADKCAGVYASVNIQALRDSQCPQPFFDFNADYNSDFFIKELAKYGIYKKVR